jgi:hypothetical protein
MAYSNAATVVRDSAEQMGLALKRRSQRQHRRAMSENIP